MRTAALRRSVANARGRLKPAVAASPTADRDESSTGLAAARPAESDVELFAYGEDCVVSGMLRLDRDRLSDVLNDHDRLELRDVVVTDLATGAAHDTPEIEVLRDDLLVAYATGTRGRPDRRTRTRQHPVDVRIGPYEVSGYVHALPGADPIASLARRPPMIALTDATIRYTSSEGPQVRTAAGVLVNRPLADSIVPGVHPDDPLAELELPVTVGPMTKDFTGALLSDVDRPSE